MNRGFLYGDGFFETIRVTEGDIPLLPFHLNRIYEALNTYQIEASFEIDEDFLRGVCRSYEYKNAIVRVNFFRDGGGKYSPEDNGMAFNHTAVETNLSFFLPYKLDIHAHLGDTPKALASYSVYPHPKPIHPLYAVKSLSSAYYVLAGKYAKDNNIEHLLITDGEKKILEELTANIIIQKGSDLYTPPIKSGGVFGATLRYLIATYGAQIEDLSMTISDLDEAEKIYLCKGSIGLVRIK